jgi:hypothetical protein
VEQFIPFFNNQDVFHRHLFFRHVMPADPQVPRKSLTGDLIGLLWSIFSRNGK